MPGQYVSLLINSMVQGQFQIQAAICEVEVYVQSTGVLCVLCGAIRRLCPKSHAVLARRSQRRIQAPKSLGRRTCALGPQDGKTAAGSRNARTGMRHDSCATRTCRPRASHGQRPCPGLAPALQCTGRHAHGVHAPAPVRAPRVVPSYLVSPYRYAVVNDASGGPDPSYGNVPLRNANWNTAIFDNDSTKWVGMGAAPVARSLRCASSLVGAPVARTLPPAAALLLAACSHRNAGPPNLRVCSGLRLLHGAGAWLQKMDTAGRRGGRSTWGTCTTSTLWRCARAKCSGDCVPVVQRCHGLCMMANEALLSHAQVPHSACHCTGPGAHVAPHRLCARASSYTWPFGRGGTLIATYPAAAACGGLQVNGSVAHDQLTQWSISNDSQALVDGTLALSYIGGGDVSLLAGGWTAFSVDAGGAVGRYLKIQRAVRPRAPSVSVQQRVGHCCVPRRRW